MNVLLAKLVNHRAKIDKIRRMSTIELKKKRKAVRRTLRTTYTPKDASYLERLIFVMCKHLRDLRLEASQNHSFDRSSSADIKEIYRRIGYEKCGELILNPQLKDSIINDITNRICGWDSIVYYDYYRNEKGLADAQIKGLDIREGEFKCKNKLCGSLKCFHYQEQTRRGDEGFTTYVICSKCGDKYHFN